MSQITATPRRSTSAEYASRATDARDRAAYEWDNLNISAGLEWDQRAAWDGHTAESLFYERRNAERWVEARFPTPAS